jgi:hypothetical protein
MQTQFSLKTSWMQFQHVQIQNIIQIIPNKVPDLERVIIVGVRNVVFLGVVNMTNIIIAIANQPAAIFLIEE